MGRRAVILALGILVISACSPGSSSQLGAAAPGTADTPKGSVVPDVACLKLDDAQTSIKSAGFKSTSHDATGQGRMQIIDSNWVVLSQSPTAGSAGSPGATLTLEVVKEGERPCPSGTSTTSAAASSVPSPEVPPSSEPTTTTSPPSSPPPSTTPPTTSAPTTAVPTTPAPTVPPPTTPAPTAASVYYANCAQAKAAGAAPLYRGQPGYREALDRDGDGIACEK